MPKSFSRRPLSPFRLAILDAIKQWPLPSAEIARRLNQSPMRTGAELFRMLHAGQVKICGTAHEAGFIEGYRSTSRVFGLPCSPILPSVVAKPMPAPHRPRETPQVHTKSGSGVIAPSPYRTGFRWGLL